MHLTLLGSFDQGNELRLSMMFFNCKLQNIFGEKQKVPKFDFAETVGQK